MRAKRKLALVAASVGLAAAALVTGAFSPRPAGASAPRIQGVIGFSYGNESAGIYPLIANPALAEAKKKGYELIQGDANGSCTKQVQNLQDFIARPVNAIVVLPLCGPSEVQASLKQAEAHHIVVVGYSQPVYGSSAAIEYNNVAGSTAVGNNAAAWYHAHFKKGQKFSWVLFTYDQCGTPCTQRTNPIRRIMEKASGVAPIEEVGAAATTGYPEMQSVLEKNPDINMVIGVDDDVAIGADQALVQQVTATHRNPNQIYIAGMDGEVQALQLIAKHGGTYGLYKASGALDLVQIGKAVADLPIEILHGRPATGLFLNYDLITKASKAKALLAAYKKYGGA
jgi:ribose transport system substrate-binding protein